MGHQRRGPHWKPILNQVFPPCPFCWRLGGIGIATLLYKSENTLPRTIAALMGGFYRTAYKKFYIDEMYLFITKKIIFNGIGRPAAWIDKNIVDGFMNLLATITGRISEFIKGFQSGKVQNYALYFFAGIIGLAVVFIYLLN